MGEGGGCSPKAGRPTAGNGPSIPAATRGHTPHPILRSSSSRSRWRPNPEMIQIMLRPVFTSSESRSPGLEASGSDRFPALASRRTGEARHGPSAASPPRVRSRNFRLRGDSVHATEMASCVPLISQLRADFGPSGSYNLTTGEGKRGVTGGGCAGVAFGCLPESPPSPRPPPGPPPAPHGCTGRP